MSHKVSAVISALVGLLCVGCAHWAFLPFSAWGNEAPTCSRAQTALTDSWAAYKATYIQADGRVRDPKADNISTSESQAYAMLRAVWMRDRSTFDSVYRWAIDNLRTPKRAIQPNTPLFSWKWGKRSDNTWGVLENASASDADEDMALALLMANTLWPSSFYQTEAQQLLDGIWENEVAAVKGLGPVLLAGDWDKNTTNPYWQLNPSYFSPVAYRVFAQADPHHPWDKLVDTSYTLLNEVVTDTRTGLPPNWFRLHKKGSNVSKRIELFTEPKDTRSDYGYDAIRIHWRIGLDYLLSPNEKRAYQLLHHSNFIERYWAIREKLPSPLTIDGIERNLDEILYPSNAIYGATLIHLMLSYPSIGATVVDKHLLSPLKEGLWQPVDDYYAQNWLWLGLMAYHTERCGTIKPKTRSTELLHRLTHLQ
ncbi:MAG: glycosyl hydrolase family 8 [Vampirovibrionales bacterium]